MRANSKLSVYCNEYTYVIVDNIAIDAQALFERVIRYSPLTLLDI